jgi:homoserine/homoserine lactone efflux protein
MSLEAWLLFCMTELVLCAIPGPGVLLIVSLSLTRGVGAGVAATMGILVATLIYFLLASTGLGAILQASGEIFFLIKFAGAAYLVWMGIGLIRSAFKPESELHSDNDTNTKNRAFWQAVATHASNPKLLIFFVAILPQFVDPDGSFSVQVFILGLSALVIQTLVLLVYALLSAKAGKMAGAMLVRKVRAVGGVLLVGAGAGLASIVR